MQETNAKGKLVPVKSGEHLKSKNPLKSKPVRIVLVTVLLCIILVTGLILAIFALLALGA
jgi:hypothetical protein